ncbi:hypothetical protein D5085_03810 [Ectothiorhodospiraceae bacterium BW-2]|nr:hypothetical protein D5085_03810 [Ectothiorhodospiraceae bacterium BW-2]
MRYTTEQLATILEQVYHWSRNQGYRGYNKHDGLNSPLLRLLLGWGKWPRMVAIQGVMRFPVNIRPLLLTPKVYNPKGLSLFIRGLLDQYRVFQQQRFLDEAFELFTTLDSIRSPGSWSGDCWGYHYPWRDPGFFAPTNTPNAVVTAFVCEAYLDGYRLTQKPELLARVRSALDFFSHDLTRLKETEQELCLAYMPLPMTMRVMDVSILIGSVMAQYGQLANDNNFSETAERLVCYVVNQQTDYGAWFYTDPASDSHIRHDNYHTGFILDALWNYMEATRDTQWHKHYHRGLQFYADKLFNPNGSPRWMSDKDYPHDIHGAAQGIITFSRHRGEYGQLVNDILTWTLSNMYHNSGHFFYQKTRYFTKKFTLLRWCNGWMVRALGSYLATSILQK